MSAPQFDIFLRHAEDRMSPAAERVVFLQTLHPLVLPWALLARLRSRVIVSRMERVPARLASLFERLAPDDLMSCDEWVKALGQISERWKPAARALLSEKGPRLRWRLAGAELDLRRAWLQWLCKEYEQSVLFLKLVDRWAERNRASRVTIGGCPLHGLAAGLGLELPVSARVRSSLFYAALDRLWLRLQPAAYALRELVVLARAGSRRSTEGIRRVWMGHAHNEAADEDNQLDLAFLCARGLLPPQENLYLVGGSPSPEAARRFARLGIRWVEASRAPAYLSWSDRLRAAFSVLRLAAASLGPFSAAFSTAHRLAVQAASWAQLARRLRPDSFITTISISWPESAAIAAMNAFGVRTGIWFFSANCFKFSSHWAEYRDVDVGLSVVSAREMFVWNEIIEKRYVDARRVEPDHPVCVQTGPLMCGDSRWLSRSPAEARRVYGVAAKPGDCFVAAFDLLPYIREARLRHGHGPSPYTPEVSERFYEDLQAALERFPSLRLLIKSKQRTLSRGEVYIPEALKRLTDPAGRFVTEGRIIAIPPSADPYIAVALAELCLGLPFTSPVLAAWMSGRAGLYHDPLGMVVYTSLPEYEPCLSRSREQLIARLDAWISRGEPLPVPPERLIPRGDPAEEFVRLIKGPPAARGHK